MSRKRIVVLWEEALPFVDVAPTPREVLDQAVAGHEVIFAGAEEFAAALSQRADLVVLPHGSAFPIIAWSAFMGHLRGGGKWLHLGGAPLTRPCIMRDGQWQVQHTQVQYSREVMIRQTWPIELGRGETLRPDATPAPLMRQDLSKLLQACEPQRAWSLQMLLSSDPNLVDGGYTRIAQGGDWGDMDPMNAVLTPLVQAAASQPYERVLVSPVVAVHQVHGPFAGGRWVLAACQTAKPFSAELVAALAAYALGPAVQLEIRPALACYHKGESPSLTVRAASASPLALTVHVEVRREGGEAIWSAQQSMQTGADAQAVLGPIPEARPGLYEVRAWAQLAGEDSKEHGQDAHATVAAAENGYWVYDEALMASGTAVTVKDDTLQRGGETFAVVGTTYMSTVTHRRWMQDPTPLAWSRDLRAMHEVGINLVRTGLWMGWRRCISQGPDQEALVRSLEALLLCAARHNIPVIFTCFAFVPPTLGDYHPYLDPQAVQAQVAFVSALARRLAKANHLLWDLINEPTYANIKKIWNCRPTGHAVEQEAWRRWLNQQASDDQWRARWRMTTDQPLSLPEDRDFADTHNPENAHILRGMDFVRFGQEMFTHWAATLRKAIRDSGNPNHLVCVGQDEGGMNKAPAPWFHGAAMDFTSNHNWWRNDDLLWATLVTKRPDRPHLIEETGVMYAQRGDLLPQRLPAEAAALQERKCVLSFAGGCGGFVQWLWNTCPYLLSDNEAGIGLVRVDGSAKPELDVIRGLATFMRHVGPRLVGRKPPRVVVIIPHHSIFSTRDTATDASRRAVRVLEYRVGIACRMVSEMHLDQLGDADIILLPAPRILSQECWNTLMDRVAQGATMLATGFIEEDEYWRPVPRLKPFGLATRPAIASHEEVLSFDALMKGSADSFSLSVTIPMQLGILPWIEKAQDIAGGALGVQEFQHGKGRLYYCPIPIENGNEESVEVLYRGVIEPRAKGAKPLATRKATAQGVLLRAEHFQTGTLWLIVNESSAPYEHLETIVPAGRAGMVFVDNDGQTVARYQPVEITN